jgi:hypothetical protein
MKGRHTNYPELARLFREYPEPVAINLRYLVDLGLDEWTVEARMDLTGKYTGRAVVFKSGDLTAVIMPMQYE